MFVKIFKYDIVIFFPVCLIGLHHLSPPSGLCWLWQCCLFLSLDIEGSVLMILNCTTVFLFLFFLVRSEREGGGAVGVFC